MKLRDAQDSASKAAFTMKDVLQVYAGFRGSTAQLKCGISALVKAGLTAMNPAIGALRARYVDRVLE